MIARLLRSLFAAAFIFALVASVAAVVLTGPVVVQPPMLEFVADVSPERLRRSVEILCGNFGPRSYRHPENLTAAAHWIAQEFRKNGLSVELQDYALAEGPFRNVIAHQAGRDPDVDAVVIAAHYDAYEGSPGADDNASGIAVLLELTRTLPDWAPRGDRYFVAFSTSEPPFSGSDKMGSSVFARDLRRRGVEVSLMLSLDGVGRFSDVEGSQRYPFPGLGLLYPDKGDFISVVGDLGAGASIKQTKLAMLSAGPIPIHSLRAPSSMIAFGSSDHRSFRELGFPAVMITDTARMRSADYHARDDTPDRLDYERMAQVVLALHGVVWDSSDSR